MYRNFNPIHDYRDYKKISEIKIFVIKVSVGKANT